MFARIRNKKGNTLAELCVVMAIIAIVSTMVVSFCTLISAQTLTISKTNEIKEDNSLVKKQFDKFVEKYDCYDEEYDSELDDGENSPYTFAVENGSYGADELVVYNRNNDLVVSFFVQKNEEAEDDNKSVKGWLHEIIGKESYGTKIPLNFIKSADFEIKENDGKCLIICTLTYRDLKGNDQTVTYMKATRVAGAVSTQEDVK